MCANAVSKKVRAVIERYLVRCRDTPRFECRVGVWGDGRLRRHLRERGEERVKWE